MRVMRRDGVALMAIEEMTAEKGGGGQRLVEEAKYGRKERCGQPETRNENGVESMRRGEQTERSGFFLRGKC